ncbi:MAG: type II toxin-antitoxin system RelE/ParE family toxin [Desulfobulbaceae bacterium]|nr:type II toxin-antitoxin system RelE/ParE family toxin [Desulfobulbaceae bacterium]
MLEKRLIEYQASNKRFPFTDWICSNKIGLQARAAVDARLNRLQLGLAGDCRSVGEGVFELRIHFGAGYRVYFANYGADIVVLLCGGSKQSQKKDIVAAKKYWLDYQRRNEP